MRNESVNAKESRQESSDSESIVWTVAQCATQIDVSHVTIIRWIEEGHLAAFIPPGKTPGDGQLGPKGFKIFRSDWENFLRARTMTGTPKPVETVAPHHLPIGSHWIMGPDGPIPTGPDGKVRCISKWNQRRLGQFQRGEPVDPPAVEVINKNGVRQFRPPKRTKD